MWAVRQRANAMYLAIREAECSVQCRVGAAVLSRSVSLLPRKKKKKEEVKQNNPITAGRLSASRTRGGNVVQQK